MCDPSSSLFFCQKNKAIKKAFSIYSQKIWDKRPPVLKADKSIETANCSFSTVVSVCLRSSFLHYMEVKHFTYFIISAIEELLFHYNLILCLKHKAEPLFHYCLMPEQMLSFSFRRIINCVFIYFHGTVFTHLTDHCSCSSLS